MLIFIGVAAAIVLITVVSVLTGGPGENLPTNVLVGKNVKGFTLAGLNGGKISGPWESGHAGVLIFFASYCGPGKSEMRQIATYIRTHSPSPVEVIAVDADDKVSPAKSMIKKDDVTFPVASDPNGNVTTGIFGFGAVPESVFVNAQGVVTQVYSGALPQEQLASGIVKLKSA